MPFSNLNPNYQPASVGMLKVLVAVLVASNLFTGLLSVYLLRNLDSRYSELVRTSATVMNDLQSVTASATMAMRRTDPFFFDHQTGEKLATAVRSAKVIIDEDQILRSSLMNKPWVPSVKDKRDELGKSGTDFTWKAEKVVALFAENRPSEAVRVRETELRPAFEHYLSVATAVADTLLEETNRISENYSTDSKFSSQVMISIASWPVLLMAGLLLATLVFVVSLLILFRVRESAD